MFPSKETPQKLVNVNRNDICRICCINIKISGRSKMNIFGGKRENVEFVNRMSTVLKMGIDNADGLSQMVCQKCQREVVKLCKVLEQESAVKLFREAYTEAVDKQLNNVQVRQKRCAKESPVRAMAGRKKGRSADAEIPPAPKQNTARRALVQEQLAEKENFPMLEIVLPGVQEIAETKKTVTEVRTVINTRSFVK